MIRVTGVRFQQNGKIIFFEAGELELHPGDYVVAETGRGLELGEIVQDVQEAQEDQAPAALPKIVRAATGKDIQQATDNRMREREAYQICQRKILEHKLEMKLVSVETTFDNNKMLFYFTANGRVDFRALVKDLASTFRTRIELRQIGVRDEARMLGGLGPCGRPICCGAFLNDFQPVSIKMAKEQNLSLNPTKISGVCGRLMCCLKYEQDQYEAVRKRMPRMGRDVITPDGRGTVVDLNVIKETVTVRIPSGDSSENRVYPIDQVTRPGAEGNRPGEPFPRQGAEGADGMADADGMTGTEGMEAMDSSANRSVGENGPDQETENLPEELASLQEEEPANAEPREKAKPPRPRKPRNDRNEKGDRGDRNGPRFGPRNEKKGDRAEARGERTEGKADRAEGSGEQPEGERTANPPRASRPGNGNRNRSQDRDQKLGQPVRRENPDRVKQNRGEKGERPDRPDRGERPDRPQRGERPERTDRGRARPPQNPAAGTDAVSGAGAPAEKPEGGKQGETDPETRNPGEKTAEVNRAASKSRGWADALEKAIKAADQ